MDLCTGDDEDCLKQQRWFVPYLPVKEIHGGDNDGKCQDEEGNPQLCILERGNPAPLQTGVSTPANCRTTDMRGKTSEAGGQCDRGAYETQINTAMPDIGNNTSRRSRTALLNVLRNDIPGDNMWIRTGTLRVEPLEGFLLEEESLDDISAEELENKIEDYAHTSLLRKHFGDKSEKLENFLRKGGKTKSEEEQLQVVKANVVKPISEEPIPQYYDDITIVNADGREDTQKVSDAWNSDFQCSGKDDDKDEECLIFYEAPHNYLCSDLPFEDYFAYSVEAWNYDSTKPLDKDELPEFEGNQAAETFTGYVQVTIDNIPPIVP